MRLMLVLALALAPASAAQEPLRATVRVVIAPTTVTDQRGAYVDGLGKQDFVVYGVTYSPFMMALTKKKDTPVQGPVWNLAAVFTAIRQAAKTNVAQALADYTVGTQVSFS